MEFADDKERPVIKVMQLPKKTFERILLSFSLAGLIGGVAIGLYFSPHLC